MNPVRVRWSVCALLLPLALMPVWARHDDNGPCGTTHESGRQSLFLHRQAVKARTSRPGARPLDASSPAPADYDIGNIAVVQDNNGVVTRQNQFNLDSNTLVFTPSAPNASQYRYTVSPQGYDADAAAAGAPLVALDDDD